MTPKPFIIVTTARSGSYHLASLLHSAPDVICHGEVFKRDRVELNAWHLRRVGLGRRDAAARNAQGMGFIDRLRAIHPKKITGFKVFPAHLEDLTIRESLLFGPHWRRILLRRNPLEAHLSGLRARQTEIYTFRKGAPTPPEQALRRRVRYDPDRFERYLRGRARFDKLCARIAAAGGALETDHAALNSRAERARLLRFIGSSADPDGLSSEMRRQFTWPMAEGVINFAEMADDLERRGLAHLLAQARVGAPV